MAGSPGEPFRAFGSSMCQCLMIRCESRDLSRLFSRTIPRRGSNNWDNSFRDKNHIKGKRSGLTSDLTRAAYYSHLFIWLSTYPTFSVLKTRTVFPPIIDLFFFSSSLFLATSCRVALPFLCWNGSRCIQGDVANLIWHEPCRLPYDVCAITIRLFDSVQHGHANL